MSAPDPRVMEGLGALEQLRQVVLTAAPSIGHTLKTIAETNWKQTAARERAVLLLCCLRDLDPALATHRREARQLLASIEQGGTAGGTQHLPTELGPEKQQALVLKDLKYIQSNLPIQLLEKAPGPVAALSGMQRQLKSLSYQRTARFLFHLGYPMVRLEKSRLRWLQRFGLLKSDPKKSAARTEALQLLHEIAWEGGISLSELDVLIGHFTGAEEGEAHESATCIAVPRCGECPVAQGCLYNGELPKMKGSTVAPPATRNLMDVILPEDRPREKLLNRGAGTLSDAELLAIILRTGSGGQHALEMASNILREAGSLERLSRMGIAEMTKLKGLGEVKAITIKAALELASRLSAPKSDDSAYIRGGRDVYNDMRGYFLAKEQEEFWCIILNTKLKVVRKIMVSQGTINSSLVHPREVFREAIKESAFAVIFVHNHPSGDTTPSVQDRAVTRQLVQVGDLMGIKVLDHVIIGREQFHSFADTGTLRDGV